MLWSVLLSVVSPAHAQSATPPDNTNDEHGIAFQYRWVRVPDAILDIWLHDGSEDPSLPDRPSLGGNTYGLSYTFQRDRTGLTAYAGWLRSNLEEGYFDDRDDGDVPDYTDGDYVRPVNFGYVDVGANIIHHAPLIDNPGSLRWEFLVGAGLGVAIVTGRLEQWDSQIDEETGDVIAAYEWVAQDPEPEPDGTFNIPPALPILDVTLGTRFLIKDHWSIRLEGGLHNFLYTGASLGYVF